MSDNDDLKKYLLAQLTKDELKELIGDVVEDTLNTPIVTDLSGKLNPMQKYYASRKIPGSIKRCQNCGQSLVNDEEHAIELMGGENN